MLNFIAIGVWGLWEKSKSLVQLKETNENSWHNSYCTCVIHVKIAERICILMILADKRGIIDMLKGVSIHPYVIQNR